MEPLERTFTRKYRVQMRWFRIVPMPFGLRGCARFHLAGNEDSSSFLHQPKEVSSQKVQRQTPFAFWPIGNQPIEDAQHKARIKKKLFLNGSGEY